MRRHCREVKGDVYRKITIAFAGSSLLTLGRLFPRSDGRKCRLERAESSV